MNDETFIIGYLTGRRRGRDAGGPYVRTAPKMPSRLWRAWSAACALVPALLMFAATGRLGWSAGAAVIGFGVGMYVVESRWIKRQGPRVGGPAATPSS